MIKIFYLYEGGIITLNTPSTSWNWDYTPTCFTKNITAMNKKEFKCFYEFCITHNLMHKTVIDALKEYDIAGINNRIEQFIELQRGYK